jgi:cytochrome P450
MVHINVMGTHGVVLNSVQVAKSILSDKGSICSDRVSLPFLGKLGGWDADVSFMDDGPILKAARRPFLRWLGSKNAVERFQPGILTKTCQQLLKILKDSSPESLQLHLRTLAGSIILDVTYGYQVKDNTENLINLMESVMLDMVYLYPGSNVLDLIPWLEYLPSWMPGTGYRKTAAEIRERRTKSMNIPFQYTQSQVASGTARQSLVASGLTDHSLNADEEDILRRTAMSMFGGGSDTTVSAMCSFFLLMALYPDVQTKAQAELDNVVGDSRLAVLSDRERLPYVNALISEVLRFGEIAPFGVVHVLREDTIHNGYFLPQGTWVAPNIWAMSRDPLVYSNPEVFDPERFLGEHPEADPREHVFGFGRRICPGLLFADSTLYLEITTCLLTLNISKVKGIDGAPVHPILKYHGDAVRHPQPVPCGITPRSAQALDLLRVHSEEVL